MPQTSFQKEELCRVATVVTDSQPPQRNLPDEDRPSCWLISSNSDLWWLARAVPRVSWRCTCNRHRVSCSARMSVSLCCTSLWRQHRLRNNIRTRHGQVSRERENELWQLSRSLGFFDIEWDESAFICVFWLNSDPRFRFCACFCPWHCCHFKGRASLHD